MLVARCLLETYSFEPFCLFGVKQIHNQTSSLYENRFRPLTRWLEGRKARPSEVDLRPRAESPRHAHGKSAAKATVHEALPTADNHAIATPPCKTCSISPSSYTGSCNTTSLDRIGLAAQHLQTRIKLLLSTLRTSRR